MNSMKFKHNKKRNCGLVYEFLCRKMSESVLEEDSKTYNKAFFLLKKYYNKGTPLQKELSLFNSIISTRGVNKDIARGVLNEVINEASKLSHKLIDIKKSNLIKEIHKNFGKEFFSNFRLNNYKAYASIQLLINDSSRTATINEKVERVQLADALINYMCSKDQPILESDKIDALVYKTAVDIFNDKYENCLNENQNTFIKKYTTASNNEDRISSLLNEERVKIIDLLSSNSLIKEVSNNNEISEKIKREISLLRESKFTNSDETLESIMLYYNLIEELESDE